MPEPPHLSTGLSSESHKANLLAQAFPASVCRGIKSLLKALDSLSKRHLTLRMWKGSMAWGTGSLSGGVVLQQWLSGQACC